MIGIHQFHPTVKYGDAITDEIFNIRRVIQKWGMRSEVYALHIDPKLRRQTRHYKKLSKELSKEDILFVHYSIGSETFSNIEEMPGRKVLIYHNITPPQFFTGFNLKYFSFTDWGRRELPNLVGKVELALADSEYSRRELADRGFAKTGVLPIMIDLSRYDSETPRAEIISRYRDGKTNILFVGRISPNKKQEDVIKAFYVYQRFINPKSRLFLVGTQEGLESYRDALARLVARLGVKDVYMTGHVEFDELIAYYQIADVFVCLSEHEGFCVPLLEAMHFNIPIVAFNATAVPDTLGNAGVLLNEKDFLVIAETVNELALDGDLRKLIIAGQQSRLTDFSPEMLEKTLRDHLRQYLGIAPA